MSEAALRADALVDNMADGVLVLDRGGVVVWCGLSVGQYGLEPNRLKGQPAAEFLHGPDAPRFRAALAEALAHPGKRVSTGSLYLVSSHLPPLSTNDTLTFLPETPGINGVLVVIHLNANSRSRADNLSARSSGETEEQLRQVVRLSHIGVFEHNHLTNGMYWSPEHRRIYGWGANEPVVLMSQDGIIENVSQVIHPQDWERVFSAVTRAHRGESNGLFDMEYRIVRRDGAVRWVMIRSQTFFAGAGAERHPVRTVGAVEDITARKNSEHQIELMQMSVDRCNIAIYWVNSKAQVTYANDHACESLGLRREELIGLHVWDFDPESTVAGWDALWDKVKRDKSIVVQSHHRRKDGTLFPIEALGSYMQLDEEEIVFVFVRDVTERQRAERELRLLHAAIDRSHTAFFSINPKGQIVYANEYACRSLGFDTQELIGKHTWDINPTFKPEDQPEMWESVRRAGNLRLETAHRHQDGTLIPVEVTANYFSYKDEEFALAFTQNITERKQMERVLRVLSTELVALEGTAFYQAMAQQLAALLDCEIALVARLKIDAEPELPRVAPRALLGIPSAALRLETLAVFEDGRSAHELSWPLPLGPWTVATLGQTIVIPSCTPDAGAPASLLVDRDIIGFAAVPLLDHAGTCLGQIAVMSRRALGDPRRVEAILKLFAVSAGAEMERQRDITDRLNAERRASRARRLESIGTLAGGIAHDLNNALTPVLLALDVLKEQYPQNHETLDNVEHSATHAVEMVRHLLTYARGSEGERVAVQMRRLLEEMEKIARSTFPKNIEVRLYAPEKLPNVLGDATQLHQVLLNLCVNARDAMSQGGILTLQAETLEDDAALAELPGSVPGKRVSHGVIVRVSDTGAGIAPEVLDNIFDPFFTTKEHESGTGLGLFTVAGIVKGHGGVIRVRSQPGQGSTFDILLPALEPQRETVTEPARSDNFSGHGELILYIDDEDTVREAVRVVLQHLGFSPLTAADGATGLKQAFESRRKLGAVITDLHMPQMDGIAFVRALRQELPEMPVIVATGRLDPTAEQELRLLGVDVFLEKPFTREKLGRALRGVLAGG